MLADKGHFVVRFDNRDCGLSTHLDGVAVNVSAVVMSLLDPNAPPPPAPYTLSDLAADVVGLLDHLSVRRAHVVGASMGGMIAQTLAIESPDRVLTLTSIMWSTGERDFGGPTAGGERTAELVPGANLVILGDMGHDLPMPLWPFMVDVIAAHTTRSP